MTRSGRAYTPAKTRNYESDIRVLAKQEMRGRAPMDGPIKLIVVAHMPIPQSWPKWKVGLCFTAGVSVAATNKPDFDNLAKIIDGLNKVVWLDDSQIIECTIRKLYSNRPRLEIAVEHDADAVHAKTMRKPQPRIKKRQNA
jgi:Holliday junction resolvase RusA-like endonuclease